MNDQVNSGIEAIGSVPWGAHFCQFYEMAEDLVDTLVPYFKAGLDGNERCMWVTAHPLTAGDATCALRNAVPDLDRRLARKQIEIIDHDQWYLVQDSKAGADEVINGWLQRKEEALAQGYAGFRLTGNTYFLEAQDWNDFAEYEQKVNACFCNHRVIALCSYCTLRCDAAGVLDVVQNHEFALTRRHGGWTMIEGASVARAKDALRQRNEELEGRVTQRTAALTAVLAEKNVLLQEVYHRVKNNLQVVSALIQLKARQCGNDDARLAFTETLQRIRAMALVHEALYQGADTSSIEFSAYLRTLAQATAGSFGMADRVEIIVDETPDRVDLNTAVPLGLAAVEAITNAFKHAFPGGRRGCLAISFQAPMPDREGELMVRDDGVGIPPSAAPGGRGAGLSLAAALARQIGGRVVIEHDRGTVWRLAFAGLAARPPVAHAA